MRRKFFSSTPRLNSATNCRDSVAKIDNEFTLKRLGRAKGQIVLRAKNKAYPVIRPNGEVEIFGGCGAVSEVLTGAV
jgi:SOS-response transcriptional repressor LexA